MLYFINSDIINKLNDDIHLRTRLAASMHITERAIYNVVKKYLVEPVPNSSLTKISAINFFKEEGYTEEEIYYTQKPT